MYNYYLLIVIYRGVKILIRKFCLNTMSAVSILALSLSVGVTDVQAAVNAPNTQISLDKSDNMNNGSIGKLNKDDRKAFQVNKVESSEIVPNEQKPIQPTKSVENRKLKSAILNWQEIPGAVMYELIVKDADTQEVVFKKYDVYAAGYQLDSNQVDLTKNLLWQVRGLNYAKVPVSDYSEARFMQKGDLFATDWQQKITTDTADFSKRNHNTCLVESDVDVAPLKLTTDFAEMDYMPVYPVYSWVPVKNVDHYVINVFQADGQKIESLTANANSMDYYDERAYTVAGKYYFNVQAYDNNNRKIAESLNSYFTVTDKANIAALGDSITHGGGAVSTPPSATLYNWETYAGIPVLNIGFSGNLTSNMLSRFDHDVLPFKPRALVIMGGVNDIRTGIKAGTVINNLSAIKEKCYKNHIVPIFLTVTPINPPKMKTVAHLDVPSGWQAERESVNKWIKSQDYFVDVAVDMVDDRGYLSDNLTTDGLHPDYEGKKHIGEAVGNYINMNFSYLLY